MLHRLLTKKCEPEEGTTVITESKKLSKTSITSDMKGMMRMTWGPTRKPPK